MALIVLAVLVIFTI